ncbi:glutamate ABC transporter substrate-binding protein [Solicola gregarius]|uniref:Glutamate ABC transporter substrate-binding protein n=1 Tax=Solicola gregarius TaxID=2908642 RepID=A0AA46TGA4_9ACTN|nr:glutamate ABC transporter substrate-binding protein [Solicola gregarius]UYM04566.1 glutamate ABC transporter substrate-binding protein [Solicola gregarius]
MRLKRTTFAVLAASMVMAVSACGDAGDDDSGDDAPDAEVAENAADNFDDGTAMKQLAEDGKVTIGVKIDQPGIGFLSGGSDIPTGFDIEVGEWLAADLGIEPEDVEWKETISDNREPFLQDGEVDLVVASYSITPERRAIVGQAGPYYITGQQLMVQKDNDEIESVDDVKGKEVCSVTGSTSLDQVEVKGAEPRGFDTYSQCRDQVLDGTVDAMTTDGSILLGYVAENPDELKVVGPEFSEERYGVGYSKDSPEMCQWITDVIQEKMDDGKWAEAFEATLGESGVETPDPPKMDACKSS